MSTALALAESSIPAPAYPLRRTGKAWSETVERRLRRSIPDITKENWLKVSTSPLSLFRQSCLNTFQLCKLSSDLLDRLDSSFVGFNQKKFR